MRRRRRRLAAVLAAILAAGAGQARAQAPAGSVERLQGALAEPGAREAIARVAFAEAANQGDSGLLAVVYTILNRLADRRWGDSIDQVVNARAQFEPVLRAGGDWRALPASSPTQRARIDTLLNLVVEGRAPDPTGGALYFQNPRIVASRAAVGQVASRLVNFGGATPSVVIGDHAFYVAPGGGEARPAIVPPVDPIFVPRTAASASDGPPASAGTRGIFVLPDGQTVESQR